MSFVAVSVGPNDLIRVGLREEVRPERGGTAFVELGDVLFTLPVDRLTELRDAVTGALEKPTGRAEL